MLAAGVFGWISPITASALALLCAIGGGYRPLFRRVNVTEIGEDSLTGGDIAAEARIDGLDFHLLGLYNHGQAPFGPAL